MGHASPGHYLSAFVREHIEQAYYARINEQAKLENLIRDESFLANAAHDPAFYSDHGVVHVRDVAEQVLQVLQAINGVLIPPRSEQQMESFLYGYGVALAYLHDTGLSDLSRFGRLMHPEFAAQAVFDGQLDEVIEAMWDDNCGNMAWYLTRMSTSGTLQGEPQLVFRELLAMSAAHSKSKVSVAVLDDPAALRRQMREMISHNLRYLYGRQQRAAGKSVPEGFFADEAAPAFLSRFYADFARQSFEWLTDGSSGAQQLACDVTDTVRALRCADAFRQRGTVEKTSGGYEIFTSQKTGNCVIALRLGGDRLYLMELPDNPDGAGEANIASSEFNRKGNLRISFHRGAFETPQAQERSAYCTAYVIADFLHDAVGSFRRRAPLSSLKTPEQITILLESTDDDPHFAEMVREQLCQLSPQFAGQVQIAPSLRNVSDIERARYLAARELEWGADERRELLEKLKDAGQKFSNFDPVEGFKHVKLAELQAGEKLIQAGEPSAFVYVPLGDGLKIVPLGGYQALSGAAWAPLGTTGVIRGDIRNADIFAEQSVSVLIIPKEIYLRYWYTPYSPSELKSLLAAGAA